MYASAWICTKVEDVAAVKQSDMGRSASLRSRSSTLEEMQLES